MANIIVSWNPDKPRRVILCSHYDTRPIADQEPNRSRWHDAFLSANDGGSGVALLMEMANHMKDLNPNVGVDFVFFDGEEYVFDPKDEYFFGSKKFARDYRKSKDKVRYIGAVLLDMVGGKNAKFPMEKNSFWKAPDLVTRPVEDGRRPGLHRLPLRRVQQVRRRGRPHPAQPGRHPGRGYHRLQLPALAPTDRRARRTAPATAWSRWPACWACGCSA